MAESCEVEKVESKRLGWATIWAFPKLRPSRPADWGLVVTVCIAAICERGRGIVLASDMMISMGWVSGDAKAAKTARISRNWYTMFSADDVSPVEPIIAKMKEKLKEPPNEISAVIKAVTEAYQEQLRAEATDKVLARYGWTLESFLRDGYRALGPESFADVRKQYETVKLDCEFMVCGFDFDHEAHIFTVSDPGISKDRSMTGFWAIGSGEYMALASLMARRQLIPTQSIEKTAYYVCEAKFMAEVASDVGKTTMLLAHKSPPNGQDEVRFLVAQHLAPLKEAWEKEVKGREPSDIENTMKSCPKWQTLPAYPT